MPALLIINYDVHDEAAMREYREIAGPILAGGPGVRLVALTDATVDLGEGGEAGASTAILEFPDVASAQAAYESPRYQDVVGKRLAATRAVQAVVVPTKEPR